MWWKIHFICYSKLKVQQLLLNCHRFTYVLEMKKWWTLATKYIYIHQVLLINTKKNSHTRILLSLSSNEWLVLKTTNQTNKRNHAREWIVYIYFVEMRNIFENGMRCEECAFTDILFYFSFCCVNRKKN